MICFKNQYHETNYSEVIKLERSWKKKELLN